jgi:hypothetical protein
MFIGRLKETLSLATTIQYSVFTLVIVLSGGHAIVTVFLGFVIDEALFELSNSSFGREHLTEAWTAKHDM